MSTWDEYAALARHLDHLRRTQEEASAGLAQHRGALSTAMSQLDQRLAAQQERLSQLGRSIGQHVSSRPAPPSEITDPGSAVRLGFERAEAADAATATAEHLARYPRLFPSLAPGTRNLVVYLGCAAVAVLLQFGLLLLSDAGRIDTFSLLAWMCGGLPAIAFFVGYLVISTWGRPRLASAEPAPRSPRLGFAICFLAMPVVYCGFKVFSALA